MITGDKFIVLVKSYFYFLIKEFNFKEKNVTNNRNLFYNVRYQNVNSIISISYENREDYLQVIIYKTQNGAIPNYDDKELTIHLETLNNRLLRHLTNEDFKENDIAFLELSAKDKIDKALIKSAKELRLCLKNIRMLEDMVWLSPIK